MIKWSRFHAQGYEVSSAGDRRFSAFGARLEDGRTIEEHYQCDVKGFDPGGTNWRLGKGKKPFRVSDNDLWAAYLCLWLRWAVVHRAEMAELRHLAAAHGGVLTDRFATTPINQARALAVILDRTSL